ncbi:hypothetical protein FHL15_005130 [Xylaria flabelliformis]|uniref:Protein kinase domain-containing protein n=1 Tax=Xylaria flabelliformis TaxID=2512241 RepID=A0A553I1I1_9PEZI|nr:hypothetical protein FHL15_005130 [Xylaria flabelliformis]
MSQQVSLLARKIQDYLVTSSHWEYEKLLGNGAFGLAVLLRQKGENGPHRHRMAVKFALGSAADELRSEISWLKPDQEVSSGFIDQTAFRSLAGIQGPVLALEYIENGDLLSLFRRMFKDDVHLPNRMLWSLYLCMIRACIGMAYPIGRPIGSPSILETIPIDGTPPQGITHNDVAPRNIMLGIGDRLDEHHLGNVFKLIDFGKARTLPDPDMGPQKNLRAISVLIAFFINMADINQREVVAYKGFGTRAGQLLPQFWGDPYPWLDPDLAGLIAECLYIDQENCPTLEEALERASDAVLNKTAASFSEPEEETDYAINQFVQTYILNC